MIRLLGEAEASLVLGFLRAEPAFNLFIIGDIEHFGMQTEIMRVYGDIDGKTITSVFLRYRRYAVYYAADDHFNIGYLAVFKDDPFDFLSGRKAAIEHIRPYLVDFEFKETSFMVLEETDEAPSRDPRVKVAQTEMQFGNVYDLLCGITEFGTAKVPREEHIRERMASKAMSMTLYLEIGGKTVSTAQATAESKTHAMVIGVATHQAYRNQGYASLLMRDLITRYLIEKGKGLCLFYDNVKAGSIYHRLGFRKIGDWMMADRIVTGNSTNE
ncbi:MAG: GNAT family N-acetyltransferase [Acholeplasmataceae bacterium]|nr:GNAT family N-acetyltransferase [Acholeplasmataceae bacterium]